MALLNNVLLVITPVKLALKPPWGQNASHVILPLKDNSFQELHLATVKIVTSTIQL